jgi:hypothetical protein
MRRAVGLVETRQWWINMRAVRRLAALTLVATVMVIAWAATALP